MIPIANDLTAWFCQHFRRFIGSINKKFWLTPVSHFKIGCCSGKKIAFPILTSITFCKHDTLLKNCFQALTFLLYLLHCRHSHTHKKKHINRLKNHIQIVLFYQNSISHYLLGLKYFRSIAKIIINLHPTNNLYRRSSPKSIQARRLPFSTSMSKSSLTPEWFRYQFRDSHCVLVSKLMIELWLFWLSYRFDRHRRCSYCIRTSTMPNNHHTIDRMGRTYDYLSRLSTATTTMRLSLMRTDRK